MPRVRNAIIAAKWSDRVRVVSGRETTETNFIGTRLVGKIIAAEFRAKMDAEE